MDVWDGLSEMLSKLPCLGVLHTVHTWAGCGSLLACLSIVDPSPRLALSQTARRPSQQQHVLPTCACGTMRRAAVLWQHWPATVLTRSISRPPAWAPWWTELWAWVESSRRGRTQRTPGQLESPSPQRQRAWIIFNFYFLVKNSSSVPTHVGMI